MGVNKTRKKSVFLFAVGMMMVSNALAAAGEAVEQWDASHPYTAIASETLRPGTGCIHDQTCLTVMSVFLVRPGWSGCLGEMRQRFARDSPWSFPLPRKFPLWTLLCNGRILACFNYFLLSENST